VSMSTAAYLQSLPLGSDGAFTGKPQVHLANTDGFGRLGGVEVISPQVDQGLPPLLMAWPVPRSARAGTRAPPDRVPRGCR
jgi:hypothetical protein